MHRNPRASCRGGLIPQVCRKEFFLFLPLLLLTISCDDQMDLRAWKETERMKPVTFHANGPTVSHQYQDTEEYESEEGSPARGSGTIMPQPGPEDDWVEELPRPMMLNHPSLLYHKSTKTTTTQGDDEDKKKKTDGGRAWNLRAK